MRLIGAVPSTRNQSRGFSSVSKIDPRGAVVAGEIEVNLIGCRDRAALIERFDDSLAGSTHFWLSGPILMPFPGGAFPLSIEACFSAFRDDTENRVALSVFQSRENQISS